MSEQDRYTDMNGEDLLLKYFDGELDEAGLRVLAEHYDMQSLESLSEYTAGSTIAVRDVEEEWKTFDNRRGSSVTSKGASRKRLGPLVAGILLLAVLGLVVWQYFAKASTTTIKNESLSPMHIALDDGTEIDLAPTSAITYDNKTYLDDRKIQLVGHAYFDVQKQGPFAVQVDDVSVEVLGTAFDIWSQGKDGVRVTCYSGKVAVAQGPARKVLSPHERARLREGSIAITKVSATADPSWLTGVAEFDNVSLGIVQQELEAHYDVTIVGGDTDLTYSGKLPLDDINKALTILSGVTSQTYTLEDDNTVRVTAD